MAQAQAQPTTTNGAEPVTIDDATNVLFVRQLPQFCTELDLQLFAQPFGNVVNVLKVPIRDLGFIEFDSVQSAASCYHYYQGQPPTIRGQMVDIKFSTRSHITKPANAAPMPDISRTSPVLLVTITMCNHPVECDTLYHIFTQYGGTVLRIIIFEKSGDIKIAEKELGTLARRLYSSDVGVAHAAVLYALGDTAAAEDAWQAAC